MKTNVLKIVLLLLSLLLGYELYANRVTEIGSNSLLLAYVFLFLVLTSGIVASAFIVNHTLRILWAGIFTLSYIAHSAIVKTMGSFLTYDTFVLLFRSLGFIDSALEQYLAVIISSLPAALCLFFGIALSPGIRRAALRKRRYQYGLATFPLVVLMLFSSMLFARGGDGANGLPEAYIPLSLSLLYAYDLMAEERGSREEIKLQMADERQPAFDLVFVIDESIRGDYLDINHPNGVYSGLSDPAGDHIEIRNYGLAAAATNCSIGSNLILRFGGTREKYRHYIHTKPSIWRYAKAAGFETVYIDAQSEDAFYNGMTDYEFADIDHIHQYKNTAVVNRDIETAKTLVELLSDGKQQFILVNKLGAHFPIHDKYPDDYLIDEPALPRGEFASAPPVVQTIFGSAKVDWRLYINSYRNTIRWATGEFFNQLLSSDDLNSAYIIYTADHGQNFHERGDEGVHTHCAGGKKAAMEEGVVPLAAISINLPDNLFSRQSVRENFNRTSHYHIFPTLLSLLGYEKSGIASLYGPTLMDGSDDPFTFNSRYEARLGQAPIWNKIDVEKLAYPQ